MQTFNLEEALIHHYRRYQLTGLFRSLQRRINAGETLTEKQELVVWLLLLLDEATPKLTVADL